MKFLKENFEILLEKFHETKFLENSEKNVERYKKILEACFYGISGKF